MTVDTDKVLEGFGNTLALVYKVLEARDEVVEKLEERIEKLEAIVDDYLHGGTHD